MSRENKWERRHTAEDERLSQRWRDEMEEGREREMIGKGEREKWRKSGVLWGLY